jgi:hypothetical protein
LCDEVLSGKAKLAKLAKAGVARPAKAKAVKKERGTPR